MTRFERVKQILDSAVGGPGAPVGGPHMAFWRNRTRDQFVAFSILGLPIVTLGQGDNSNLIKALRGQEPFGEDTGTPGATFPRMPAGRPAVPAEQIALIARWIDDGCPEDEEPLGLLEIRLNGGASGAGFVIVSTAAQPLPATLSLRTTDGSEGDVSCRPSQASAATLSISPNTVHVSGQPVEVHVLATTASQGQNDTTVEVVRGTDVVARYDLTAIQAPMVRFAGRFQCRLPTDPDPFDHPWGENSSFGVYAVRGPDPANPDEPPLDRIIRFQDGVAVRPFCAPVGVAVIAIEAEVGGSTLRFRAGERDGHADPLIGLPVRLGPNCKFDGRNRTFALDGFEPISDFRLEIGTVFAGAAAAAVERLNPVIGEHPSTAPYADGIFLLDAIQPKPPWIPADFGYQETTWAEHAWAVVATKLAQLVVQQTADARAARIRQRRIQEHVDERDGHGLSAITFPLQLMERYTGKIDRDLTVMPNATGTLAYLATLPVIGFAAEFFDFDTDCQTGTVTGTLGALPPEPPAGRAAPPAGQVSPPEGRVAPPRRRAPRDQ
jgi:hypothetical protein